MLGTVTVTYHHKDEHPLLHGYRTVKLEYPLSGNCGAVGADCSAIAGGYAAIEHEVDHWCSQHPDCVVVGIIGLPTTLLPRMPPLPGQKHHQWRRKKAA